MQVLIIKMSSLGDIIHTLPALTDAGRMIPGITFDWIVEENFVEIPAAHPLVNKVIPIAFRRWRKNLLQRKTWQEWCVFKKTLRETKYDLIIDAQGLLKSVFIGLYAKGEKRIGLDKQSAREPFAALFYQQRIPVAKQQHAVTRVRELFARALDYDVPTAIPEYGLDRASIAGDTNANYLVFLHGTTWPTKHWPEAYWIELAKIATANGYVVKLPWGNDIEKQRAERIAAVSDNAEVLPRKNLMEMVAVLAGAKAVIAVDTGLLHLTAALDVPAVSLYGPTNPVLSGGLGRFQKHLAAEFPCAPCMSRECVYEGSVTFAVFPPCFTAITPSIVWMALNHLS